MNRVHYALRAKKRNRGVAQLGRALRSGRRGRVFESRRLDLQKALELQRFQGFFII